MNIKYSIWIEVSKKLVDKVKEKITCPKCHQDYISVFPVYFDDGTIEITLVCDNCKKGGTVLKRGIE